MGVSKSKKKIPFRVKKAIRRSLSGVCMVSAIIVALVPAQVSEGYSSIPADQVTALNYNYGVASDESDDITLSSSKTINLDAYTDGTNPKIYKTYYVRETQGNYEYGWQFELYSAKYNGNTYGVICNYNSSYQTSLLEINKYLATSYLTISDTEYNNFYQAFVDAKSSNSSTVSYNSKTYPAYFEISYPDHQPANTIVDYSDEWYFKNYFPTQYENTIADYNTWKTKYDNYQAYKAWESAGDTSVAAPNNQSTDPGTFEAKVWVSEMDNANNNALFRKFFCDINEDYNNSTYQLRGNYTLVSAYDYTQDATSTTTPTVYLVKGEPNLDYETGGTGSSAESKNDSLGFYVNEKTSVIAIGDQAFKGVLNVDSMTLAGDIAFIGDEAFIDSYVKSITFSNVSEIGNRAFKNCSQLSTIYLGAGTSVIGTEAFYGCSSLANVSFPYSVKEIGPGAFAECTSLTDVNLSEVGQADAKIGGFAFFNDVALNNISFSDKITSLGDACLACTRGATGSLTEITLPINLTEIGDFLLAGRGNLQYVNMPSNLGRTQTPTVTLPEHMFWNCYNLHAVVFADDGAGSCGYIDFEECDDIFSTITYSDFYVKGPALNAALSTASPRKSTWGKISGAGNQVPYVYVDSNGEEQYEVSDGQYILVVDNDGTLTSVSFIPASSYTDITMTIPQKVGNTEVKAISSTCFDNSTLKEHMKKLIIEDDTISEIADGAFKNYTNLEYVSIGNSVTKIGASAFEGCTSLTYVNFETPKDGYESFPVSNIGANAFSTGSSELTFEGDIDENYGPFVWATDTSNFVDSSTGLRVCYKTGAPYYQTVIVDNRNGYPTLVDYPHYEQLNKLSGTEGASVTITDSDDSIGSYDIDTSLTKKYEAILSGVTDVCDSNTNEVLYSYYLTTAEEALVNAALNINIPAGVKSIDANGFMNNTSKVADGYSETATNNQSVAAYCRESDDYATYRLYGLFNGYYGSTVGSSKTEKREYDSGDSREEENQGNDRITSVTMSTVKYLPDDAFYSCEQLSSVVLGSAMEDLGNAPFAGCTKMTSVGSSSPDVICYNGIIYSVNDDGTYNILECLSSRGTSVGSKKIKISDEDPYLSNVSSITPGAFKNCTGISAVDLTGMDLLTEIPDECFMNCKNLNQVVLPENITSIGKNAFAGCMEGIELVIYGEEVYLPSTAFGTPTETDEYDYVSSKRVISYEDSAVRKAAEALDADVSEVLDDTVKVQFYDYDGTELSKLLYVTKGASIALEDIPSDPVREGYTFAGWNKALTNITEDSVIVATYTVDSSNSSTSSSTSTSTSTSTSGSSSTSTSTSTSTSSNNLYTLTVTNGNGSGSYAAGATVIITCTNPPTGKVFDKWVPTETDLGIASVNVAATTLTMPAHSASVSATFKDASSSSSGSSSKTSTSGNNSSSSSTKKNANTNTIVISKSGISNTSLASAQVTGSNDNYVIRVAETANATAAVETALTNEYGSLDNIRYTAMDITLYDATGTNKITNYSGLSVTITMPIPDVLTQYAGNNKAAGVVNEKLDKLDAKFTTIDGVPCITFTATHFSPYTIYVDTGNLSATATIDGSPKTGDGIAPKWFLSGGLAALSIALFFMKDKKKVNINSYA